MQFIRSFLFGRTATRVNDSSSPPFKPSVGRADLLIERRAILRKIHARLAQERHHVRTEGPDSPRWQ